jgi:hypothetical protein
MRPFTEAIATVDLLEARDVATSRFQEAGILAARSIRDVVGALSGRTLSRLRESASAGWVSRTGMLAEHLASCPCRSSRTAREAARALVHERWGPQKPIRLARELAARAHELPDDERQRIGIDRPEALRLAIRCARDSMPAATMKILADAVIELAALKVWKRL